MNDQLVIPEGLSKKERKAFKRNFYREIQQKQGRSGQWKKYGMITAALLIVVAAGYWLIKESTKPNPGEFIVSLGNKHIDNMTDAHESYNSLPPTSGTHMGGKADWGISDKPIPDELQIHNLEDGGVMVQYNCAAGKSPEEATKSATTGDCKKLITDLTEIVKKYKEKVLLAPYPKLDTNIALTAWTRIDKFNHFDAERIEKFIKSFKGIDHHR